MFMLWTDHYTWRKVGLWWGVGIAGHFMSVGAGIGPLSFGGRLLRGLFYLAIFFFAVLGVVAVSFEIYGWHVGDRWRPEEINALIAQESPARVLAGQVWSDIKFVLQYGTLLIGAVGFAIALTQLKTIAKLIADFIVARGPIYTLSTTISEVEVSVGALSREVDRLSKLEPAIRDMAEKIEETFAQIASLQRLAVSERTDSSSAEASASSGRIVTAPPTPSEDEKNWERLREIWNNNGERLDGVIERITDKRRRARFQRMPRTNYPAIINALGDEGYISEAARNASLELHSTFMSYKPRNRKIPDSAVAGLEVLDRMLAYQLAPPSDGEAPSLTPNVDIPIPEPV